MMERMKMNPLLMCDFYKTTHMKQYPKNITKLVSYFTPRMTRLRDVEDGDKIVMFGLQYFCKDFLQDTFNKYFFGASKDEMLKDYDYCLGSSISRNAYDISRVEQLYDLGYLPLEIKALPEGSKVPMKVPCIEISNTHPDFAWLVNSIESILSCEMWHSMISAFVGNLYRGIVNEYFDMSVEDDIPRYTALGDFSMRGQESYESAVLSSAGWSLSFANTATVPVGKFFETYYNGKCSDIKGAISTEHSVMTSNFAVDGNEIDFIKRMLTEIYPNDSFSMVSDSYDFWNLVTNILPSLRKEIEEHNGCLLIRGDSGDPVDIICGEQVPSEPSLDVATKCIGARNGWRKDQILYCIAEGAFYQLTDSSYFVKLDNLPPENKGLVECLWDIFGGTINSKGYKVLNPKVKAIYGDSITPQRCKQIYERLIDKGFACNNVVLGVGSFSMQCLEMNDRSLSPYTRDTFGIAVKSTFGIVDGKPVQIFKDPKTDKDNFKKSQKGLCVVLEDENYGYAYQDGFDEISDELQKTNALETVFRDGKMVKEYSVSDIRKRLTGSEF